MILELISAIASTFTYMGAFSGVHLQRECIAYEWSKPKVLRGPNEATMYVESPQLITDRDTLWLIGSPTWAWDSSGQMMIWGSKLVQTLNLAGLHVPILEHGRALGAGTEIRLPPGARNMSTPLGALGKRHALHLLWRAGWGDTAAGAVSRVFSSRLVGTEWSPPEVLIDPARHVTWVGSNISEVADIGGTPYVFAPLTLDDSVLVMHLSEKGWVIKSASFANHIYSGIANIEGDSRNVFVTFVRNHSIYGGEFDVSSNKLARFSPVASFAAGATIQTRAIARTRARRGIVWMESSTDHSPLWKLRIAESIDSTATWRVSPPLEVASVAGILSVTSDSAGRVHVLIDGDPVALSSPVHAVWNGKTWQKEPLPKLSGFVVPSPTIIRWGPESLLAVWAMAESTTSRPTTFWAIGTPCKSRN